MTILSPLETAISKLRCINIKEILENLEDRIKNLQTKTSDTFKNRFVKTISLGSVLLFLVAYNVSADIPKDFDNETPSGVFK